MNSPIKFAGGKRKLAEKIISFMPSRFDTYVEPFVGGGAVFFALAGMDCGWKGKCDCTYPKSALGDINDDLINFYKVLRDTPKKLIAEAQKYPHDSENFAAIRDVFNMKLPAQDHWSTLAPTLRRLRLRCLTGVERAAMFLYLNKTCFNGLWRVNSKGEFNVPFGRYTNPTIVDESALLAASQALAGVKLVAGNYAALPDAAGDVGKSMVIYCDPPYDCEFTKYAAGDFTWEDQRQLERVAASWKWAGAHVIVSNADTPRIRALYKASSAEWKTHEVMAARSINSKGSGRGKIKELIFT